LITVCRKAANIRPTLDSITCHGFSRAAVALELAADPACFLRVKPRRNRRGGEKPMQRVLRRLCFFSTIAVVALASPGTTGRADAQIGRIHPGQYVQFGVASWYGPWHQGRRTANGERFDMHKLTAAHKTLPLDSKVRVTNLANGKSVEVTINDRGPYVGDRVIDLSERAAQRLGMKQQGVATVRVEVVDRSTDGYAYD
jgi:hypothetical protein